VSLRQLAYFIGRKENSIMQLMFDQTKIWVPLALVVKIFTPDKSIVNLLVQRFGQAAPLFLHLNLISANSDCLYLLVDLTAI
jgi:hypothetical protein